MFNPLPTDPDTILSWKWMDYEPYFRELQERPLTEETAAHWLYEWSELSRRISEAGARLSLTHSQNTIDAEAEKKYFQFLDTIQPAARTAEQALKEKLLASGFTPAGMEVPLRNLQAEADLFRAENLPLLVQEDKLGVHYDKIVGAQTVKWQGKTLTIPQLRPLMGDPKREVREHIWRKARSRELEDRQALNELWRELFILRLQIATQAGKLDYRGYAWQDRLRFDYSPADSERFHRAIEEVCVPAANRLYERRRQQLGLESLRPWDLNDGWYGLPVRPPREEPLRPFQTGQELAATGATIFKQIDPILGEQFQLMQVEGLLDLENRANKSPGAYCTHFAVQRKPFIFMNAVGLHRDVQTLLHETGHAFHNFAKAGLPYYHQARSPMEFNEVASMAMELLAAPFLPASQGGFYSQSEAARARREHLEDMIYFWPFMAVVDAFQHWAYVHPSAGAEPAHCDQQWRTLWQRFIPAIDWSNLEDEMVTGWQRKLHIFQAPFYYIEYGLAALGAAQVWRNARQDPDQALQAYRRTLALGGTATLPKLYETAGARLAFDASTLGEVVELIEQTIETLETEAG